MTDRYDYVPPAAPEVPTQIAFPWRAVVRTLVASLVAGVLSWLARQGITFATPGLEEALIELVSNIVWVLGTGAVTWLLTRPRVAAFLAGSLLAPDDKPRRAI